MLWSVCFAAALVTGCDEEPLRTYTAAKDPPAKLVDMSTPPAMPPGQLPSAKLPSVVPEWTAPASWKRTSDGESGLRFATYHVEGQGGSAEMTVVAMPGVEQDLISNINRWRGQLKLPETTLAQLDPKPEAIRVGGDDGAVATLVDIEGAEATDEEEGRQRMLTAIVPHGQHTWYFKLLGPFELVAAEKRNFGGLINSLRFVPNKKAPAEQANESVAAANGRPAKPAETPTATGSPSLIKSFKAPADWRRDEAGSMRLLSFKVGEGQELVDISVVALPGDGGGALENINRWRGQVGLPPIEEIRQQKVNTLQVGKNIAVVVDMDGPATQEPKVQRMLVALMVQNERAWFFKMLGSRKVIGEQRTAFEGFVQSIELGG